MYEGANKTTLSLSFQGIKISKSAIGETVLCRALVREPHSSIGTSS